MNIFPSSPHLLLAQLPNLSSLSSVAVLFPMITFSNHTSPYRQKMLPGCGKRERLCEAMILLLNDRRNTCNPDYAGKTNECLPSPICSLATSGSHGKQLISYLPSCIGDIVRQVFYQFKPGVKYKSLYFLLSKDNFLLGYSLTYAEASVPPLLTLREQFPLSHILILLYIHSPTGLGKILRFSSFCFRHDQIRFET